MSVLIRLLLMTAYGGLISTLILTGILFPPLGILAVVVMVFAKKRRLHLNDGAHGTATLATNQELYARGYLGPRGLIVGAVSDDATPSLKPALKTLFDARWNQSAAACEFLFDTLSRRKKKSRRQLIRIPDTTHMLVVAPTGTGKGVSYLIPNLLADPRSAFVLDMKGENYRETAAYRQRVLGHRIRVLDPFGEMTQNGDSLNPLDLVDPTQPTCIDELNAMANAIVIREGHEEPHWPQAAEMIIRSVMALVATHAPPEERHLGTVAALLAGRKGYSAAVEELRQSSLFQESLQRLSEQLSLFRGKEKFSVLTTVNRHLDFMLSPSVEAAIRSSSFDPLELKTTPTTVYLIIPPAYFTAYKRLLRLWINTIIRRLISTGPSEARQVMFYLDECGQLGPMDTLDTAVTLLRGYGIRLSLFYQSLGQIETCFPDGRSQTFLSNMGTQVYFGPPNDYQTAEAISSRIGDETITVGSFNEGTSYTRSVPTAFSGHHDNASRTTNSGWNYSSTGRRLLKPEEIMQMEGQAIIFTKGCRPILSHLIRYYDTPELYQSSRQSARLGVKHLLHALLMVMATALVMCIPFYLRQKLDQQTRPWQPVPLGQHGPFNPGNTTSGGMPRRR